MRMKKKLYKRHGDKRKEKPSDGSVIYGGNVYL